MPPDTPSPGLRWNLLDEALIRWRCVAQGDLHHSSLPALLAAMAADTVRDFPALRPHQRHPWHAFLSQLAAIALHRAGQIEPWTEPANWRAALLALTPDDADGAAWCLVAPAERPALLQAPMLKGLGGWDASTRTPDALDMLGTSKNHDLKQARMRRSGADDWLFALVSLQTQAGSNSGSYKGISRMNSGAGSRPCVAVAPRSGCGQRWQRDVRVLLQTREQVIDRFGFAEQDGVALLWLPPWDESIPIAFTSLDPHYIEICRRVRLVAEREGIVAATCKTPVGRIQESEARKGVTGDAWAPVDKEDIKVMAVPKAGFGYERVSELLLAKRYEPSLAQSLAGWPDSSALELICCGVAADGMSKTSGYHDRRIPVSPKLRRLMAGSQKVTFEKLVEWRVHAVRGIVDLLEWCLDLLLFNGAKLDMKKDRKLVEKVKPKVRQLTRQFEAQEDARFFDDLTAEVEANDEQTANALRLQWQFDLVARAEFALIQAFDFGPRSAMQRYKARSAAHEHFRWRTRSAKSVLPDLANHYAQRRDVASEPQGHHHA